MAIKLRKKPLANGKNSLYLDIYTGEERKYEFLKLYLYKRPKDELERLHNKEVQQTAENIRAKRELQIGAAENGITPAFKSKVNFLSYFESFVSSYKKKDIKIFKGALKYLKEFTPSDYLSTKDLTESFCFKFKDWLDSHNNLNGETPSDYFARFKRVLKQAVRDKIIASNPAQEVVNKRADKSLQKDVLTVEELQALAKAMCGNTEVKRAFLFACNTGLRFCDIKVLKWKHIQQDALKMLPLENFYVTKVLKWKHIQQDALKMQQQKTDHFVRVNLNSTAQRLLGEAGQPEEEIFTLPSHTAMTKALRHWKERAGLTKKVTFHVARHSFATNLLIYETDVKTVSSLLGHTSLTHTQKYVRVVEALKQNAVNRLPEIDF